MASQRLLFLLASLLLLIPALSATHQLPEDVNAVDLNVLVWHPYPDEQGDPWGFPLVTVNGTQMDWMAGYHGAFFYPTAVFDGVTVFERPPTGEGGGAFQETYQNYRRAAEERLKQPSPVRVRIEAGVAGGQLVTNVSLRFDGLVQESGLFARIVLYEDDVGYNGGNGVTNHRFVVRDQRRHDELAVGSESAFVDAFMLQGAWRREALGVVVIVQNGAEDSRVFKHKEILQAATWTVLTGAPTVQASKGPLLELYSATWCEACVYGDAAADTLANEMGIVSAKLSDRGFEYLRPVPVLGLLVALAAGAAAAFLLARSREGPPRAG